MMELNSVDPPAAKQAKLAQLRQAVNQVVGLTFFDTLMKVSENSPLKSDYGHGGAGERVFMRQRNMFLTEQVAKSPQFELGDFIYKRLARYYERNLGSTGTTTSTTNIMG